MSESEFEKLFPNPSGGLLSAEKSALVVWQGQREGWIAALKCVRDIGGDARHSYTRLRFWIDNELKANEIDTFKADAVKAGCTAQSLLSKIPKITDPALIKVLQELEQ